MLTPAGQARIDQFFVSLYKMNSLTSNEVQKYQLIKTVCLNIRTSSVECIKNKKPVLRRVLSRVEDRARTGDPRYHKPML